MQNQLLAFLESVKGNRRINSFDESATKQAIVLKILSVLGWDTYNIDEVYPEYSIAGKRVDYALRNNNANKVFIEVKKINEDLDNHNHQEQLLNYSFQEGVRLSILTNGISWWFYLPLLEGKSWEQRKFYTIDLVQQDPKDVAAKFVDFLSKENVISGNAIQKAEAIYKGQQKTNTLMETLPKAWNKLVEEADPSLLDLINDTTENISGFRADAQDIEGFLAKHKNSLILSEIHPQGTTRRMRATSIIPSKPAPRITGNYTGVPINAFHFKGTKYGVRSYKDMLMKLCDILYSINKRDFEKLLNLSGKKRPYFTRNSNELRAPQEINGIGIFVETNLNANIIVKICFDMIAILGYSPDDLKIETR